MTQSRLVAVQIANSFSHPNHVEMLKTAREIDHFIEYGAIASIDYAVHEKDEENTLNNNEEVYTEDNQEKSKK